MAMMSPPIAVADATSVIFRLSNYASSVSVQTRFYDINGVEITPGTGSRDITARHVATAYEGKPQQPVAIFRDLLTNIDNGLLSAATDGEWYELSLAGGLGNVVLSAAQNTNPGGAVTYRIFVEADGWSELYV